MNRYFALHGLIEFIKIIYTTFITD